MRVLCVTLPAGCSVQELLLPNFVADVDAEAGVQPCAGAGSFQLPPGARRPTRPPAPPTLCN